MQQNPPTPKKRGRPKLTGEPSPSKRQKQSPSEAGPGGTHPTMQAQNMYTFKSNSIDSIGSILPENTAGSPLRKKNNVVRPTNFTPSTGKKLVVKNLKKTSKSNPDHYYGQMLGQLHAALDTILNHETQTYSMEELYKGVESICRQRKAEPLFQELQGRCKKHISGTVKNELLRNLGTEQGTDVLQLVTNAWATWKAQLTIIRSMFCYLDRSFLLNSNTLPMIAELGKNLFRDHIFSNCTLKPQILQEACALLARDREHPESRPSDTFDSMLFQQVVNMFRTLGVYTKEFEPMLLGESETFFRSWSKKKAASLGLAEYVKECNGLFQSEVARCDIFSLDSSTKRELTAQMDTFLIEDQEERMVRTVDVADLLEQHDRESLRSLFKLLERKGLVDKLRSPFEEYINATGSSIVFDEKRESEMVVRLLLLKKNMDTIYEYSFASHRPLGYSLKEAFETFINKTKKTSMTWGTDNDKPGEMIAKYVDLILRGGSKAIPQSLASGSGSTEAAKDEDIDNEEVNEDIQMSKQLDQVLDLFRFVHGKAVFEAFYKKDLAKRLLMNRSANADAEKSMLSRLKSECGAGFTHNLEQMFKDMELAREENTSYKSLLEDRQLKQSVDLNVSVLSASAWPTYPAVEVEIPTEIQKATRDFEKHYKSKYNGRKLDWMHSLAHCQVKAAFPKGNKEIVVSCFQAVVLLYFNEKAPNEAVSYIELQEATKLKDEELKRTLQSLACARYRVLLKSPKGRDVNATDKFVVDPNFTDAKYRIKINQIQLKETREENKQTHERVAADRQYETQAAIVRIMKSKKRVKHALLVANVIDATKNRGSVNADDIKKQIEKLIDKDYMERADDGFYEYVS